MHVPVQVYLTTAKDVYKRQMKNSHKRRKRKGKVIWGFIGVLVLTAAIVFGLFRVNEISVSGNSTFTSAQIQQAILQDGLCQNLSLIHI